MVCLEEPTTALLYPPQNRVMISLQELQNVGPIEISVNCVGTKHVEQ